MVCRSGIGDGMKKLILVTFICLGVATTAFCSGLNLDLGIGLNNKSGSDGDGLVLEAGDYLLLETGDYLLLE